jgi:hypothetical protein
MVKFIYLWLYFNALMDLSVQMYTIRSEKSMPISALVYKVNELLWYCVIVRTNAHTDRMFLLLYCIIITDCVELGLFICC